MDWTAASGYHAARRLLGSDSTVTALFVANDQMAIGSLRAIEQSGRRVPDDISVVGYDDIPEAAYPSVPLTTVRQNFQARSTEGMAAIAAINGTGQPHHGADIPVEIVLRDSTERGSQA